MKLIFKIFVAFILFVFVFLVGFYIGKSNRSYQVDSIAEKLKRSVTSPVSDMVKLNGRRLVLLENPELIGHIMEGGSFGNENFSIAAAQNMFSKDEEAIEDIIDKTEIQKVAANVWFIRIPLVNCTLVETDKGLVLIDTGMKPAGPALLKAIRNISDKSIHTIIYTHGHVDHSYGTWALIEAGEDPEIIAHENIKARFNRYIKLKGSIAKYMSQPVDQLPIDSSDIVWPTRYFDTELNLEIGGVRFELKHFKGETDDQLFVWIPDQKIVLAADYYQGFLPNAGNGKRVQRNIGEWIHALETMDKLQPEILIPSHGEVIDNNKSVTENLNVLIDAMRYIHDRTTEGLNAGLRKDQIFQSIELPAHLRDHPLLKEQYVTAKDISKMIIKQYTGWWDDIPSNWSPAAVELQAQKIAELAGGTEKLVEFARVLSAKNLALASHFADWAYFADPQNPDVQQLVLDIYKRRILSDQSVTQEMLVYLDYMSMVRESMN